MPSYFKYQTKAGVRYGVRWHNPNPRDGEPPQPSKSGFIRRRDAVEWYEFNVAGRGGVDAATPLGDYLSGWLDSRRRHISESSLRSYRYAVESVSAIIGHVRLRDLRADHIRQWQDANVGKAAGTVRTYQNILSAALNQAVEDELLLRNPASRVRPPRNESQSLYWSPDTVQAFLDATRDDYDALPYRLMLYTGIRPGECIALTWDWLDLRQGRLTVTNHVAYDEGGRQVILEGTKTDDGRTIALPERAVRELRAWRPEQKERRLQAPVWFDYGLVFTRAKGDGKPIPYTSFIRRLSGYCERLGLPRITPHDLRHSWSTWMAALGVHHLYVQQVLGHKSIRETLDTYSHISEHLSRQAASQIDAALERRRGVG